MTTINPKATNAMKRLRHLTPKSTIFVLAFAAAALVPAYAHATPSPMMAPENPPVTSAKTAPDASFRSRGHLVRLATYHGQKLIIWEVATWCGSCKAGLKAFAHHQALIDRSNLKIIVLRDYKNGGYPGITIEKFAAQVAPTLLKDPHFVFGDATKELAAAYDPHHYVDIYQLIDAQNQVVATSSAPSVTFGKIKHFIALDSK
ncbi:TlpA family protein disulfide reductase [Acidiphilium multivorum]|uniref:TlpA family protein disulfide reductase n=1 Tax=Acidiphilium multivorum TaxID=62140 RepID=UPI001B8D4204|nr:redoxin family protein [Acidiphilium multivorum]MBS3025039.1 redoxin family protein [Acidiphilium multivorum]